MPNENKSVNDRLYEISTDPDIGRFQNEARQRWENTKAYRQSMKKIGKITKAEMEKMKKDGKLFTKKTCRLNGFEY